MGELACLIGLSGSGAFSGITIFIIYLKRIKEIDWNDKNFEFLPPSFIFIAYVVLLFLGLFAFLTGLVASIGYWYSLFVYLGNI